MSGADDEAFVVSYAAPGRSVLVPDIELLLASELTPLWQATEAFLNERNMSPPFWAFAWPGSEALARYVSDHPEIVRGKAVLDFAAGGGLAAIAAARQGAAFVEAAEIDPLAIAAIRLNARLNGVCVSPFIGDITAVSCRWDVVLAGDVCYEAEMAARIMPWLHKMAQTCLVILADPGRKYAPAAPGRRLASFIVPTSRELEAGDHRTVDLYAISPG